VSARMWTWRRDEEAAGGWGVREGWLYVRVRDRKGELGQQHAR
jgi:hypothetical protein